MRANLLGILVVFLLANLTANGFAALLHGKKKAAVREELVTSLLVTTSLSQCKVDLDGHPVGMTGAGGTLLIQSIEPGDHYLHVQCPGLHEKSRFVAPHRGENLQVAINATNSESEASDASGLEAAESRMRLRQIARQAVQLRASGQFAEAVKLLREATVLDPKNGDLHRELGITFLLTHEWERARVEMLEAVHHEPESAEAHSGLAYAYEKLGNLDEALKEYRICTHLDPSDASYHRHYIEVLGDLYGRQAQGKH